ncbi:MCE family protein [Aeromicrobium sp. CTD01-1L150]|uniref:MCE family protein n=1 Tax=Aeromicrobium sp. CTD01-1L150 TaxID=3341830 RepID=UPI0035C23E77
MRTPTKIVGAVAATALVAGGLTWYLTQRPGTELEALFESTVGLYPGSDVQVLGVPVGTVTDVEPDGAVVRVSMELDRGQEVGAQTAAVVVAPTLVSDRFVQLTEPDRGGPTLASGTVLEPDRTAVPVEIDEMYESLTDIGKNLGPDGANADGALGELLDVAAENLDGQGAGINQMITEFGDAFGTLADSDDDLFATIANFSEFNDMLVSNDDSVAAVNRQFATVTDYLAEDREDLAGAIDELGSALAVLDDFIRDNRGKLKTSVDNLIGPTQVLTKQRRSLEEAVRLIPLALQNFLRAYDPSSQTLSGRGNLNELSIQSRDGRTARSSNDAPPLLVPTDGDTNEEGGR